MTILINVSFELMSIWKDVISIKREGNVLAEIRNSIKVDDYHVIAKKLGPQEQDLLDFSDIK